MLRRVLLLVFAAAAAITLWSLVRMRPAAPSVDFASVRRETLVSTVATNGKVEPLEWTAVRAVRDGLVEKVLVEKGQWVAAGAPLAVVDSAQARTDLQAAEARIAQVREELRALEHGGRPADLAEIQNNIRRVAATLDEARKEQAALERLLEKNAATRHQVEEARRAVERAEIEIRGLENRRAALVATTDRSIAQARLREAEAAAEGARMRIERSTMRSAREGVVYQLDLRAGAWVNPGDVVAYVGLLDRVRVVVYVDEPELGRVSRGMPVAITWDGLAGREWRGTVDKMPTQVVALGSRQVGEVACVIDNPKRELAPGANVNAEIRSQTAENALVIPKEAIRSNSGAAGVYVLDGDRVRWRPIRTGVTSLTRVEVVSGVAEGDRVALPGERALTDGGEVRAVMR